jgi:hypothetical protein
VVDQDQDRVRLGRRRIMGALVAAALALPLLAAVLVLGGRWAEDTLLRRAAAQVEQGRLETALETLAPLKRQRLLSREARRRAAALYFRLGEDRTAHTLLRGIPFNSGDPEDQRLRALSARCQRAAALVKRLDRSRDLSERVALIDQARDEVPDNPELLRRQVEELLQAMLQSQSPAREQAFTEAYTELRRKAPGLAASVKERAEEALARGSA